MTDEPDDENPNERDATQEWAFIFNELGEETVRGMLFDIARTFSDRGEHDERTRRIIEVREDTVLDITDHVDTLEEDVGPDATHDFTEEL